MKIKPIKPQTFPLKKLNWEKFLPYVGKAHAVVGKLNEILKSFKNPLFTLAYLKTEEAMESAPAKKPAVVKGLPLAALNDRTSLEFALKSSKPFTDPFFFEFHRLLHVAKKKNEKFRKKQRWIGLIGRPIEKSKYFPPNAQLIASYLKNLRKYYYYTEKDRLVQLALYFAQFLAIYPFIDGNGRVAQIQILVYVYRKRVVSHPLFFMCGYFRRHYNAYYNYLFEISKKKDWESWIIFFLKGVIQHGKGICRRAKKILELEKQWVEELLNILPPQIRRKNFDFIFANLVFTPQRFSSLFHLSKTQEKKLFRFFRIQKVQGNYVCKNILHAVA